MTVVISDALVLDGLEFDTDNPIIGWQNLVTTTNLSTTSTEDTDFPLTNVANPSTYLRFQQSVEGEDLDIEVAVGHTEDETDYVGVAGHNWGTQGRTVRTFAALEIATYALMLHMDGLDGATSILDSSDTPRTVTVNSVVIDTARSKFGGASALFGGSDSFLSIPYTHEMLLGGQSFTVDLWFNCNLTTGLLGILIQQVGVWSIKRLANNTIQGQLVTADGTFTLVTTETYTDGLNAGWHHVAMVRNGTDLYLFIDGVLADSDDAVTGDVVALSPSPNIFVGGDQDCWNGWIDEVRIDVGLAQWISDFIVPQTAYATSGEPLFLPMIAPFIPRDNTPLLVRFEPDFYTDVRVIAEAVDDDTEVAYATVVYTGKLTVVERKIQVSFTPLPMGRKSEIIGARSERGNFLGRAIVGAWVESSANIRFMSPDWYREFMDDFVAASETTPFFFAWAPVSYPYEVGFAWCTDVPQPEIFENVGLMGITLNMQGIAA